MEDWPPSNYPIFLALVLLAATAVTLAMGDEPRAESLAIYAYYLLVIGVAIRFFELALPENTLQRLGTAKMRLDAAKMRILDWLRQHAPGLDTQKIACALRIPPIGIPHFHPAKLEKILAQIADISRNVAILLSVFFAASIIYGLMLDWWVVKGYISNLVLIILGFLVLYFFTRAGLGEQR